DCFVHSVHQRHLLFFSLSSIELVTHMLCFPFFFFNDPPPPEIYTLSLHDALPISRAHGRFEVQVAAEDLGQAARDGESESGAVRSEEHTSELQSLAYLVCRLLLEKKKNKNRQKFNVVNRPT